MKQKFQLCAGNMSPRSEEILRRALERRLAERGCVLDTEGFLLEAQVNGALHEGEYRIAPAADGAKIIAGDDCAVFAGIGAFLTASLFDGEGSFEPSRESVMFVPERAVRGLYFATHFHNFYHVAPMERVFEQIEDAALRGGNAIAVWYDMHHYQSIDEPESQALIDRLKKILSHARKIGMLTCITMLSNESFAGSPLHLRAQSKPQNGYHAVLDGHYGVEICPSRPGGIEEIVRQRRIVLDAFADVQPDYVIYWPYDQGGCTCADCAPWGVNGFLRLLPHFRKVVEEVLPGTRIIVSTWYFDLFIDGEWDAFYPLAEQGAVDCAAYLMDFFPRGKTPKCISEGGLPAGKKMLAFPEISMYGGKPWGGFGANPLPAFLQESNDKSMHLYAGQFCYSEGIFEDINKAIMLDACSGRRKDARESAADYARMEFCTSDTAEIVELMELLEQTLPRTESVQDGKVRYLIAQPQGVERAGELARRIDERLSERVRQNWRWRILYLRAQVDALLLAADGYVTEACDPLLEELSEIYCVCNQTLAVVAPPTMRQIQKRLGHGNRTAWT